MVAVVTGFVYRPRRLRTRARPAAVGLGLERRRRPAEQELHRPAELGRRELAFVLADGVYVGRADGGGVRRITNIPGFEYQPDWTADGTKLVLRVDDASGRSGGVWSVNADGSDPVDLVKTSGVPGGAPDWSPDGTTIAFVGKRLGERFGIYVMNADGSDPIRLTSQAYEAQYPDWSPDGARIAVTIVQGGQFDIYVMDADGSGLRQLTRAPGAPGSTVSPVLPASRPGPRTARGSRLIARRARIPMAACVPYIQTAPDEPPS